MIILGLGLLVFLGVHSIRVFADDWRAEQRLRLGEARWKSLYTLVSVVGFGLILWGFHVARGHPVVLWTPAPAARRVTAVLTLPAFVLLAAAYVPGNRIKAWTGHPMVLGTMIWAIAHLLANATLAHAMLFGGFLIWATAVFRASRRRDRTAGVRYPVQGWRRDALAIGIGVIGWIGFAAFGHAWLTGTRPLGA